uniref:Homologous recombination OB-fold protein OB-fold domain-containing protein n=1 Tax=Cajanus cajan TaxID=3821 RepID=A0A151UEI1_CAJCA
MSRRGVDYVPDSDEEQHLLRSEEEIIHEQLLSQWRRIREAKEVDDATEQRPLSPLSPPPQELGDDNDDHTFRSFNIPTVIPGPAGMVQAEITNRQSDNPLSAKQLHSNIGRVANMVFNTNPWRYALHYVKSRGLPEVTPLINIDHNLERVATVVAFVDSMTPTGNDNYTLKLKDPTATIGASLHYKAKDHPQYGQHIVVGCVLVLREVIFVLTIYQI